MDLFANRFEKTRTCLRAIGDENAIDKSTLRDMAEAAKAFGAYSDPTQTHPQWNPDADTNQDGKIDIKDLVQIAKNFGTINP